jgi:hypothetical protein
MRTRYFATVAWYVDTELQQLTVDSRRPRRGEHASNSERRYSI